jgi:hypothetical protein
MVFNLSLQHTDPKLTWDADDEVRDTDRCPMTGYYMLPNPNSDRLLWALIFNLSPCDNMTAEREKPSVPHPPMDSKATSTQSPLPKGRKRVLHKKLTEAEIKEADFEAYLGSEGEVGKEP